MSMGMHARTTIQQQKKRTRRLRGMVVNYHQPTPRNAGQNHKDNQPPPRVSPVKQDETLATFKETSRGEIKKALRKRVQISFPKSTASLGGLWTSSTC